MSRLNIWDPRAIYLTGHSLGTAMATITAALLTWKFPASVLHLTTFGSPRAGRSLEWHLEDIKVNRYVYGNDIVTQIPSSLFYRHVGESPSRWVRLVSSGSLPPRKASVTTNPT